MISVFYGSHLFSCPLRTLVVVVEYMRIYVGFKFFECLTSGSIYLILHMTEERFGRSIVQAVSFAGHGLYVSHFQKSLRIARMRIMKSLIGLYTGSSELILCELSLKLLKCILNNLQAQAERNFPGEYFGTCHIFDNGKIAPLSFVGYVGDIGSEFSVWDNGPKFTIQYIRGSLVLLGCFLY